MVGRITAAVAPPAPALAGADGSGDDELVTLAHVRGQMRASSLQRLARLAEAHPEATLAVLRRWLSPEE
jgi:flagellar M-ring protein FliF